MIYIKKTEAKFDFDKEFDKVMSKYNKEKKDIPGKDPMDKIDYLLSTMDYNDDEYDSLYDRFEDYFENDENCKNKKENTKESNNMLDLRKTIESKKNEDDKEIKFVNKGDEFKSDKADTVKIVDIDKKDDKTEVTYKVGDDEKKGDIEDVLKMLNGAEYSKVEDKKDDDKKSDDKEDDKDKKKESVDDNSVEVILTEDFHVPGTDVVLEAGDVIYIIPKVNENKKLLEEKFNVNKFNKLANSWGEGYATDGPRDTSNLIRYLDSCGFEEEYIDDLNNMSWDEIEDEYHGKPVYAYSDDDDFLGDWADDIDAYFVVYHPDL